MARDGRAGRPPRPQEICWNRHPATRRSATARLRAARSNSSSRPVTFSSSGLANPMHSFLPSGENAAQLGCGWPPLGTRHSSAPVSDRNSRAAPPTTTTNVARPGASTALYAGRRSPGLPVGRDHSLPGFHIGPGGGGGSGAPGTANSALWTTSPDGNLRIRSRPAASRVTSRSTAAKATADTGAEYPSNTGPGVSFFWLTSQTRTFLSSPPLTRNWLSGENASAPMSADFLPGAFPRTSGSPGTGPCPSASSKK